MTTAIVIFALVAGAAIMIVLNKKNPPKEEPERYQATPATDKKIYTGVLDRSDFVNDVFIAGLEHHCSKKDVGWFTGKIFNEADNPYDKKAMAIGCIQSKKIIGYVPSAILTEYRKWCGRKDCRCVGYIFYDGEHLRGRVRAYLPDTDQDKLVQDVESYIKQAAEHFGWNVDGLDIEI